MRKTLVDQRSAWQLRLIAQLFHQGVPAGLNPRTRAGREALARAELSPAGRELVSLALRMLDVIDLELVPLDRELRTFAARQPGCRALSERLYGVGPVCATAILAELGDCRASRAPTTPSAMPASTSPSTRATSRSSVSRAFVARTRDALAGLMARRLDDVRLAVMMLDGIELKGRTNIVALGVTTEGVKVPLGLWEGSTENATVATALLSDLVERGLDAEQGILFVIDGAKALRKAIRAVFGQAPSQRCVRHKERNVLEDLPEHDRLAVRRRLRAGWAEPDHGRALSLLGRLASDLERTHPGAAGSLREGLEETLTVTRLGITGPLKRTLESTSPCESMIECVRRSSRNVKRWSSGEMALRWTAAGMLEAERQFRRITGYRDLAKLAVAVERNLFIGPWGSTESSVFHGMSEISSNPAGRSGCFGGRDDRGGGTADGVLGEERLEL
jgi:hypothetical protein